MLSFCDDGFSLYTSDIIAAGAVIIEKRDGKECVLLVRHGDKPIAELQWKFPGGKVAHGETLEAAAIREAREELGVEITLGAPLPPMLLWNEVPESGIKRPSVIVLVHFLGTFVGVPTPGVDIKALDWFPVDALLSDCAPNVAFVLGAHC